MLRWVVSDVTRSLWRRKRGIMSKKTRCRRGRGRMGTETPTGYGFQVGWGGTRGSRVWGPLWRTDRIQDVLGKGRHVTIPHVKVIIFAVLCGNHFLQEEVVVVGREPPATEYKGSLPRIPPLATNSKTRVGVVPRPSSNPLVVWRPSQFSTQPG